jgi:hypothetical protein
MSPIWTPPDKDDWGVVQDIEATKRVRQLPDGRVQSESRLTLSPEAMEQLWQGYRCAKCLERLETAWPEVCPNDWCRFPIRELQRQQLQIDFVEQHPPSVSGFPLDRELAHLEKEHYVKKGSVTPGKEL